MNWNITYDQFHVPKYCSTVYVIYVLTGKIYGFYNLVLSGQRQCLIVLFIIDDGGWNLYVNCYHMFCDVIL